MLKLPPVDIYREPFIQPLGHLVLVSARFEAAVIEFFSTVETPADRRHFVPLQAAVRVAEAFRAWTQDSAKPYVARIEDTELRDQVGEALRTAVPLRERRNRIIHDAIEPALMGDLGEPLEVQPIHIGFGKVPSKTGRQTRRIMRTATPEDIAHLACNIYDLAGDFESFTRRLQPPSIFPGPA